MLRVLDLLEKKKDGVSLSADEIDFLVQGYTRGDIPDYQMAAWLMAVYFRGLDAQEILDLTRAMLASGKVLDLAGWPGVKVDKHSTGGVGDKTTLVLAPLLAAAGVTMVKMSGRGLGFTGGTIDKLEAVPGYRVTLEEHELLEQVRRTGVAVVSQTPDFVPADKKIYALRDATATVDSLPLIASSIMSKKLAAGAQVIILDVKVGEGAFLPDLDQAAQLAQTMVEIGSRFGRRVAALLTSMDEPLGRAVGNALEVAEAVEVLAGEGPGELKEVCLELGSRLLLLAGLEEDLFKARVRLEKLLANGTALAKYREWITAQGGNPDPRALPRAGCCQVLTSPCDGYVTAVRPRLVGQAARLLGAGRSQLGEAIDPAAGIVVNVKIGDYVRTGQELARMWANDPEKLLPAAELLHPAFGLGQAPSLRHPLVYSYIC